MRELVIIRPKSEKSRPRPRLLTWKREVRKGLILNTDASSVVGATGVGFIARTLEGAVILVEAMPPMGIVQAEAKAIRMGLERCKERGLQEICIQTDSKIMAEAINYHWKIPWRV